jgi:chromosome segregation ATPase
LTKVGATIDRDVQARLDALANRLETSLLRARAPVARATVEHIGDDDALAIALRDAEARTQLQVQRCQALEQQRAELEAELVEAHAARAQAEALADAARREADLALQRLDAARREQAGSSLDNTLSATLQGKLLEVERLTSELAELRRSNEDWRSRARNHRRELDSLTPKLELATAQLGELRNRDEALSKRVAELERTVAEQRRELEIAERRAKHLRQHMGTR